MLQFIFASWACVLLPPTRPGRFTQWPPSPPSGSRQGLLPGLRNGLERCARVRKTSPLYTRVPARKTTWAARNTVLLSIPAKMDLSGRVPDLRGCKYIGGAVRPAESAEVVLE